MACTQNDDDEKRKAIAADWSAKYHMEIKPEQINCNGCKLEGPFFSFCESICGLRSCNIERNTENFALCPDYKCEMLEQYIQIAPPIKDALEALRKK